MSRRMSYESIHVDDYCEGWSMSLEVKMAIQNKTSDWLFFLVFQNYF